VSNPTLNQIKTPINEELTLFENKFRQSMKSSVSLLDTIMTYIVKRKGKQMRPMFVLFTAKLNGGITEPTYRGAALVELLHTATLVHDDVVDDSNKRRGFFSINALWKNKIAVLVGDYLLSKGLLLAVRNKDFHLLEIVSDAVEKMSEGELLQIEKARKLNLVEDVYFDIITKKTASLIASCCAIGTASVIPDDKEKIEQMRLFGEKIGIAFQIKDDLFDYGTDDIGKPLGIDIKEKKLTLPLIYALNNAPKDVKRKLIYIIKNQNTNTKKVKEVVDYVHQSGGIEYAQKEMHRYKDEALEILNRFPNNESQTSLHQLVDFVIARKK
jgi:octaprenyl-diphosphate synthase